MLAIISATAARLLGDSVALSGDGNTMAVGAPNESSSAKGINGNQNDTSVYSAGAVYVYHAPQRHEPVDPAGVREGVESGRG